MESARKQVARRKPLADILICAQLLIFFGCNGAQYLFSSDKELISTPADTGLDFVETWFKTADNIRLHGWQVPGRPDMPLVVIFHGNAANISRFINVLRFFHQTGFSTFIFDYRGFGLSSGRVVREEDLYNDGRGAIDHLAAAGWHPSSMIYFGHSMGAAVSLQMSLEKQPAALVLESPFTSMSDIAWHRAPVAWALLGLWALDFQFDNLDKIQNVTAPLVIFTGAKDEVVPMEMSQQLFDKAVAPSALFIIAKGGHKDLFKAGGEVYQKALLDIVESGKPVSK